MDFTLHVLRCTAAVIVHVLGSDKNGKDRQKATLVLCGLFTKYSYALWMVTPVNRGPRQTPGSARPHGGDLKEKE